MKEPRTMRVRDVLAGLPDSARLWVFGMSRPLEAAERARLLGEVDGFLERWKAHGHPLAAGSSWEYERFLLVGVDDRITPPSGCSIDALVRALREIEEELDVEMVGGAPVWYREGGPEGELRRVSRSDFRNRVREGEITPDTIVYDLSLTRVGELRDGRWELPARESWHGRYFEPPSE
jgi:hypothetical protein